MKCAIPECSNSIKAESKFNTCQLCRNSITRWMHRKVSAVLQRRQNLHMYDHRMRLVEDYLLARVSKKKVVRNDQRKASESHAVL